MLSQRLRSPGILDATPYLHAGYRCCAACAFAHLYTSCPNWRRRETCAKDKNLYPVLGDDTIWNMLGQLFFFTSLSRIGKPREAGCLPFHHNRMRAFLMFAQVERDETGLRR